MATRGNGGADDFSEASAAARSESDRMRRLDVPDVRQLRRSLKLSQRAFAAIYRIPLPTLKNWEQGRRLPDAPAAAYLLAIARLPTEIGTAMEGDA